MMTAIELLARIATTVDDDITTAAAGTAEPWMAYSPVLGWERKPGFRGAVGRAEREFDEAGYDSVDTGQVAHAGRKRVVFLGDSNTFGLGTKASDTFVEVADRLLPDFDLINLGVVGYSSYQGRVALERYLPLLEPDLVVVSFNFNDRRYVTASDLADGPDRFRRMYAASTSAVTSFAGALELSHVYRGLRRGMRAAGLVPRPVQRVSVNELRPRVDEDAYRRNLADIAELARRAGVPVLFLLLGDNPLLSEHLRRGVATLERGDQETAIAYLSTAVRERTMFSDLARVHLAKACAAKGDAVGAANAAVTDSIYRSFTGGTLIRLDRAYNGIMREVALDSHSALLDGAAILDAHPSVYVDFCHFDADGHRLLGIELAARIPGILAGSERAPKHTRLGR